MKAAYYSRNNSYSRSYNAEVAESNGRLPLTRAASALGISAQAFKRGCEAAGYTSSEWHHVGKYANRVDYYDTHELRADVRFWIGARTKANRSQLEPCILRLVRQSWMQRMTDFYNIKSAPFYIVRANGLFGVQIHNPAYTERAKRKALADGLRQYGCDCFLGASGNPSFFHIVKCKLQTA